MFLTLLHSSYNVAAMLESACILWHHSPSYCWAQMKIQLQVIPPLKTSKQTPTFHNKPPKLTLLSISPLRQTWYKFAIRGNWIYIPRDTTPITSVQLWIPHLSLSNGITTVSQLYTGEHVSLYETLSFTYNLHNLLFYQFLKMRHTLQTISWSTKPNLPSSFHFYFLGS